MKQTVTAVALAMSAVFVSSAFAQERLARFDGGIGSQPLAGTVAAPIANDVNGVLPGGRPWIIKKLRATIDVDGNIRAKGEGLILGGGGGVGTRGGVTQVAATLFCGAAATLVTLNSPAVPLDTRGDFEIRDKLSAVPPSTCENPVLIIRNAPGGVPGAWFAAGIPERDRRGDD